MSVVLAHGEELHPEPAALTWLTAWEPDPVVLTVLLVALLVYVRAVLALRRRGDHWPPGRTVAFVLGLLLIGIATMSSLAVYDTTLFSVHAVQHMVLQMAAPVPLALSAPVTLALRTLPRSPRRRLLSVLHSRPAALLVNPIVGFVGFVVTPIAMYNSSLFAMTLENPMVHRASHLHFLLLGCIFFWPLLGIDPLPGRLPYPARVLLVFLVLPMHVLLGISIMSSTDVYGASHYVHLGRQWGASVLADQQTGGAIMWAFGDIAGILFLAPLLVQWLRADEREAAREDRRLDRVDAVAARE